MKRKLSLLLILVLLVSLTLLPVQAHELLSHVTDAAGLLNDYERTALEDLCAAVSDQHNTAVYIVTVDDFRDYGSGDVFEVTYQIYHEYELGKGSGRDGVILLLSMWERDYALFVYGGNAEYALNDYGQTLLEDAFLPFFAENDWYGGFEAYAETCQRLFAQAEAGEPVQESPATSILVAVILSFLAALIVCSILRAGMKNVRAGSEAGAYISAPLNLTRRHDQFTHKTQTRTKIQSSSGSSSARSGGGGSGRSGKF